MTKESKLLMENMVNNIKKTINLSDNMPFLNKPQIQIIIAALNCYADSLNLKNNGHSRQEVKRIISLITH